MIPDVLLKKQQPFHDLDLSVQHLIFSLSWLDKVLTVKHGGLTAHELMLWAKKWRDFRKGSIRNELGLTPYIF